MVELRGVGGGLRLRDDDIVVMGYHYLGGGCCCCWWKGSGLGFGRGGWGGDVAFACAPGDGDSVHKVVVSYSKDIARLEGELVVMGGRSDGNVEGVVIK